MRWIAALAILGGCADAVLAADGMPSSELAARAVAQAKSMKPGQARDAALRSISRNLRHAERDHAIEAARAMSEDYELRSFGPGPDTLDRLVAEQQSVQSGETNRCTRYIKGLKSGSRASEERVRACLHMDDPPGIVPRPLPLYRVIMAAAEALPPSRTKAELFYMATWDSVPDRPAGGAQVAVRHLRALLPDLDGAFRREAASWLETTSVDLIEGKPDAAIARVRAAFESGSSAETDLSDSPATKAQGLISDFLSATDIERAVAVTSLFPTSEDCSQVFENLPAIFEWVLPTQQDDAIVAAYLDRLQTTGIWKRLCPNGVDKELAAEVWLGAGNEEKALEEASASGKPIVLAKIRVGVVERRLSAGDAAGAKTMIDAAAADLPSISTGTPLDRLIAARLRIQLIHQLVRAGDAATAERLADRYPGPGWRGFAYSVIVDTTNRKRAGPEWDGPLIDLQEVAADL